MTIHQQVLTLSFQGVVESSVMPSRFNHVIRLSQKLEGFDIDTIGLNFGWCGFKVGDQVRGSVDINCGTGITDIATLRFDH